MNSPALATHSPEVATARCGPGEIHTCLGMWEGYLTRDGVFNPSGEIQTPFDCGGDALRWFTQQEQEEVKRMPAMIQQNAAASDLGIETPTSRPRRLRP